MKSVRRYAVFPVLLVLALGARITGSPSSQNVSTPPATAFYKEWKMSDLLPKLVNPGAGHDWEKGRSLFDRAACGGCHSFGRESEGTGLAPDLTGVTQKFSLDFVLQSILEPSAAINGQFFHTTFVLKDGKIITGSIVDTVDNKILVAPVMLAPQVTVEIAESDVKSQEPSLISPMPVGLLNQFTEAEVLEFFAFLEADGDRSAPVYTKK